LILVIFSDYQLIIFDI